MNFEYFFPLFRFSANGRVTKGKSFIDEKLCLLCGGRAKKTPTNYLNFTRIFLQYLDGDFRMLQN